MVGAKDLMVSPGKVNLPPLYSHPFPPPVVTVATSESSRGSVCDDVYTAPLLLPYFTHSQHSVQFSLYVQLPPNGYIVLPYKTSRCNGFHCGVRGDITFIAWYDASPCFPAIIIGTVLYTAWQGYSRLK